VNRRAAAAVIALAVSGAAACGDDDTAGGSSTAPAVDSTTESPTTDSSTGGTDAATESTAGTEVTGTADTVATSATAPAVTDAPPSSVVPPGDIDLTAAVEEFSLIELASVDELSPECRTEIGDFLRPVGEIVDGRPLATVGELDELFVELGALEEPVGFPENPGACPFVASDDIELFPVMRTVAAVDVPAAVPFLDVMLTNLANAAGLAGDCEAVYAWASDAAGRAATRTELAAVDSLAQSTVATELLSCTPANPDQEAIYADPVVRALFELDLAGP
jgi:hypothetical protein